MWTCDLQGLNYHQKSTNFATDVHFQVPIIVANETPYKEMIDLHFQRLIKLIFDQSYLLVTKVCREDIKHTI